MLEKTVEEILRRYPREVWPDLSLTFIEAHRNLGGGCIPDLRYRDAGGRDWIVELKRGRVAESTLAQLDRYLKRMKLLEPDRRFAAMAVGFSATSVVLRLAREANVTIKILDEGTLRLIAARHELPVDHEAGHRPTIRRLNPRRSGAVAALPRAGTSKELTEFKQALYARFPPGTLDVRADVESLRAYWRMACPSAPSEQLAVATALSQFSLSVVPGSALSDRMGGKSDPYTTVVTPQKIVAAIDARQSFVKFDFYLPEEIARLLAANRRLRIWQPRGYSTWVLGRVGSALPLDEAMRLFRQGIAFEFNGVRGS